MTRQRIDFSGLFDGVTETIEREVRAGRVRCLCGEVATRVLRDASSRTLAVDARCEVCARLPMDPRPLAEV